MEIQAASEIQNSYRIYEFISTVNGLTETETDDRGRSCTEKGIEMRKKKLKKIRVSVRTANVRKKTTRTNRGTKTFPVC